MTTDSAKSRMTRILRLHDEVDAIKADIRDIYAEEKADGGDKTAMGAAISIIRKREKDKAAFDEQQGIVDVYLTAYLGTGTVVATHTHAPEPQPAPVAALDLTAVSPSPQTDSRQVTPIQPETANEPHITAGPSAPDTGVVGHHPASRGPGEENGAAKIIGAFTGRPYVLRPNCQRPERCAGQGREHCWDCRKAMNSAGAA